MFLKPSMIEISTSCEYTSLGNGKGERTIVIIMMETQTSQIHSNVVASFRPRLCTTHAIDTAE